MAQNVYDRADFFANYSRLPRSLHGLDGAPEWPDVRAQIPPLAGKHVLDLGCGFGWFSRWAAQEGAASVLGIDISRNMIERARQETVPLHITYEIADLETLHLPEGRFDFAYSSLALHYIEDLSGLLRTVQRALVPGSRFVLTIEHPIYMAPSHPDWIENPEGAAVWPLNDYAREGLRRTDWLSQGVVKFHRRLGTTLNLLIQAGFSIRHVNEWAPSEQVIEERPEFAAEAHRPMFVIIAAEAEAR